jgi:hypothetical protein
VLRAKRGWPGAPQHTDIVSQCESSSALSAYGAVTCFRLLRSGAWSQRLSEVKPEVVMMMSGTCGARAEK